MGNFRDDIARFLVDTGMSPTAMGQDAVGDSGFVSGVLDRSRQPRLDTVERVYAWMDAVTGRTTALGQDGATVPNAKISGETYRILTFTLRRPTPLLNTTLRTHFRQSARLQTALAWEIKLATEGRRPATPFHRAKVTIERRSVGKPDLDGVVGGAKSLIDCLIPFSTRHPRGLGIISDDNPSCMVLEVRPIRIPTRETQGTVVRIEELPLPARDTAL